MKNVMIIILKVACGLLVVWGGFTLQSYLWPIEPTSDIESTESSGTN